MKVPRDVNATGLVRALHIRLTTTAGGTHHVTVQNHRPLKPGTLLGGVLKPFAAHHGLTVEELNAKLEL